MPKGYDHNGTPRKVCFTETQRATMSAHFSYDTNPDIDRRQEIANEVGLQEYQVRIWFQNKRARSKTPSSTHRRISNKPKPNPAPGSNDIDGIPGLQIRTNVKTERKNPRSILKTRPDDRDKEPVSKVEDYGYDLQQYQTIENREEPNKQLRFYVPPQLPDDNLTNQERLYQIMVNCDSSFRQTLAVPMPCELSEKRTYMDLDTMQTHEEIPEPVRLQRTVQHVMEYVPSPAEFNRSIQRMHAFFGRPMHNTVCDIPRNTTYLNRTM